MFAHCRERGAQAVRGRLTHQRDDSAWGMGWMRPCLIAGPSQASPKVTASAVAAALVAARPLLLWHCKGMALKTPAVSSTEHCKRLFIHQETTKFMSLVAVIQAGNWLSYADCDFVKQTLLHAQNIAAREKARRRRGDHRLEKLVHA